VGRAVRNKAGFASAAASLEAASTAIAAGDHAELSLLNRTFHQAMYAGCGNPLLVSVLDDLRDRAALISVVGWETSPSWEIEWQEHQAILTAATEGDAEQATELTRQHIQGFLDRMVHTLEPLVES
jgi:DNA-binding GntR family transcriptional regulator